jgi:hypothetical protein
VREHHSLSATVEAGMARVLLTVLGLGILGLGIWLIVSWWAMVAPFLLAIVALGLTLLGLVLVIFGISELAGALSRKPPK